MRPATDRSPLDKRWYHDPLQHWGEPGSKHGDKRHQIRIVGGIFCGSLR